ncbi:IS3 family transposase [Hephaestia caeni]|uniref:IS3 family transposase n=1 Tax=Hephaestia caeni TaxID=645617 RepID=UPI0026ADBF05
MLGAERSSYHYRGCRADQADPKKRMREIAEARVRYGYRRIHVLLRRESWDVNAKRIYGEGGFSCDRARRVKDWEHSRR